MSPRRALLAALLAVLPGAAEAQQAAGPRRPRPRARRARREAPARQPAPPPAAARGEPAPVPNRDLEAPRPRGEAGPAPRVNPALIDPDEPRIGAIGDRSSLQAREDRLLRTPAPGARLRVPFAY
ncbi:hypothetical protein FHS88_000522 [Roseomonas alkaliterrae]|uniref:Translation initiation factor IF-2 n=2 Tax=Neoroseomonas alkaliterrae TaxID=1452450 RepID=A0A840Y1A1_9PROT|nr:hypothetical protein [Neoroseomonas alkaliterrae]MBB5688412.1 hypothetical protein [Neoroseomonas alkaliterrae]